MKGLIITGSTQAKSVSDSLLLFRKEAAWKGKGEKKKVYFTTIIISSAEFIQWKIKARVRKVKSFLFH